MRASRATCTLGRSSASRGVEVAGAPSNSRGEGRPRPRKPSRPNLRLRVGPAIAATKIHVPQPRAEGVKRTRLTELLRDTRPALALIVAPPGFGKTTVLTDWAAADPREFAWVSIDQHDNDRTLLWASISAALGGTESGGAIRDRLNAVPLAPNPAALAARDVEGLSAEIVLVLDDFHLITDEATMASVLQLVELAIPNLEIAIATRVEPPSPLARLRTLGQLLELRATDLQFT